jgi:hypothetical protein
MHYYIAFMEAAAREKLEEPTSRARNWQFSELFLHKHHLLIKWAIFYALCGCIFFKYGCNGAVSHILDSRKLHSVRIYERDSLYGRVGDRE